MSKKVGHLYETPSAETGVIGYVGEIGLAMVEGPIALAPVDSKRSERSPDFTVKVRTRRYGWQDHGLAWWKEPNDPRRAKFLSIRLDHETMVQPVNVAAFPPVPEEGDEPDRWLIVWGRARGGAARQAPPADPRADDEIPF